MMKQKNLKTVTDKKPSKSTKDKMIKKLIKEVEANWHKDSKNVR